MKFFADTADVKEIKELNDMGLLDGVTTNPSLILKSGGSIAEVTKQICDIVEGPVSAEVVAMLLDGRLGLALLTGCLHLAGSLALTWVGIRTVQGFIAS